MTAFHYHLGVYFSNMVKQNFTVGRNGNAFVSCLGATELSPR